MIFFEFVDIYDFVEFVNFDDFIETEIQNSYDLMQFYNYCFFYLEIRIVNEVIHFTIKQSGHTV